MNGARTSSNVPAPGGWQLLDRRDGLAIAGIAGLAAWLFRDHLLRILTFLGNPDRVNNSLKVLKFHVDSLAAGTGLHAWNEHELLGYDTFALPYTFSNPISYLVAAFGPEHIYVTAGYVSALLLALSGVTAYFFLRDVVGQRLAAAAGAMLYQLAAISVLKVSQNDTSFLVIVLIPLLLLAMRRSSRSAFALSVVVQAALLYVLLQFTFLQKAAYALMLLGAYAVFLARSRRDRSFVVIPAIALAGAVIAALPRFAGVAAAMSEHTRGSAEALAQPIGAQPLDLLRWLDGTIFGRFFGDPVWEENGVNLSEGFLLYTSTFVPFVLFFGAIRSREAPDGERRFFAWTVVALFAVIALPWLMKLVWLLFAKINFIHARILISALLPLVTIVALRLRDLRPAGAMNPAHVAAAVAFAALGVAGIEAAARLTGGAVLLPTGPVTWIGQVVFAVAPVDWTPVAMERSALIRIALTALATLVLMLLIRVARNANARRVAYTVLVSATVIQAGFSANFQLNGPHTRGKDTTFWRGNISWAEPGQFEPPSQAERGALQRKLDDDHYRSIAICDRSLAGGFCAAHLSEFWKLRLADGYYGFGAPARMATLPWKGNIGMRDLSFASGEPLPWTLLGFLNVRSALVAGAALYGYGDPSADEDRVSRLTVLENPEAVLPRAFFVQNIVPIASARDAVTHIFEGGKPRDVRQTSYVEGAAAPGSYLAEGRVALSGGGDGLVAEVEAAPKVRFLVVNELYNRRWTAEIDGRPFKVFPVNAVMRGVVVPAGATRVTLRYQAVASLWHCVIALILGTLLIQVAILAVRRAATRHERRTER